MGNRYGRSGYDYVRPVWDGGCRSLKGDGFSRDQASRVRVEGRLEISTIDCRGGMGAVCLRQGGKKGERLGERERGREREGESEGESEGEP
jgi:hypothetical protein